MTIPDKPSAVLESRFLPPDNWQWGTFKGAYDGEVRYGYAIPQTPKGHVIILPGLSEFGEKYFETARDWMARGYGVWVMDWQGQGKSHRHLPQTPHRRSSVGFRNDLYDLNMFIRDHVKRTVRHAPLFMLAHSMGANIGLRFLHDHSGVFTAAALSAPMIGIKALSLIPVFISKALLEFFSKYYPNNYAPGGHDFDPAHREAHSSAVFSNDPVRNKVHNIWSDAETILQVGGVTWRWLYYAERSCRTLRDETYLGSIDIPCIMALAGHESLVSNRAIRRAAALMPNAKLLELPESRHEIMMEIDAVRTTFFDEADSLFGKALNT